MKNKVTCVGCPYVKTCQNKKALFLVQPNLAELTVDICQPNLRDTTLLNGENSYGATVGATVYKDDINIFESDLDKMIRESILKSNMKKYL